ncbi:MAG: hypothetical protein ACYCOO_04690 [Chitinophagaceae bacterium]
MNRKIIPAVSLLCCAFLFCSTALMAQQSGDSSTVKKKTTFKIGLGYNTDLNYFGRTDSLTSTGLFPSLELDLHDGLYLSSNFIFLNNSLMNNKYAATILEGGYKFKNPAQTVMGNLFVSKFFYNANTSLIQSALQAQTGVNVSFLNKVLDFNVGADAKFSDHTDFGLTGGIDHIIKFTQIFGKGVLVLDPAAYVYSGTQNFTSSYYQKNSLLFVPVDQQQITQTSQKFNILSYEFSVPVVYAISKFDFIFSPSYVLPQNVITPAGSSYPKDTNLFYAQLEVTYTL